jgi:hypothetical protein
MRMSRDYQSPPAARVDGVVTNDAAARTLVVRLSERAEGYARLLWREGHRALMEAEANGFRTGAPTLWASAPGSYQIAHGLRGENGTLRFHFQPGEPAYQKLVSKPGLTATVVLDRETSHTLNACPNPGSASSPPRVGKSGRGCVCVGQIDAAGLFGGDAGAGFVASSRLASQANIRCGKLGR